MISNVKIPAGVEAIGEEDLYYVPLSMLIVADPTDTTEEEYQWYNPRRMGDDNAANGFNRIHMDELQNDIRDEGLMCPLICRWKKQEDTTKVQILDGERRFRSIEKLVERDEQCWSRKEKKLRGAKDVHSKVPCRIIDGTDKEALRIAFMVSDRAVGWGEAATAKLVRKLRQCKCTDVEILDLTKKSSQWLREMDRICGLDELTFSYLSDAKINRALALKLADIKNIEKRHEYLHKTYDDAVAHHQEEIQKADEELEKAEEKEELAEVSVIEAEETEDPETIEKAKEILSEAKDRTEKKRQQRTAASRPQGKTKNLRNVVAKKIEENQEVDAGALQALSEGKIRQHAEDISALSEENDPVIIDGVTAPTHITFTQALQMLKSCYKGILSGEEEVIKIIKRQIHTINLYDKRAASK